MWCSWVPGSALWVSSAALASVVCADSGHAHSLTGYKWFLAPVGKFSFLLKNLKFDMNCWQNILKNLKPFIFLLSFCVHEGIHCKKSGEKQTFLLKNIRQVLLNAKEERGVSGNLPKCLYLPALWMASQPLGGSL